MPGMLVIMGTRHTWNSFPWGQNMFGMFENFEMRISQMSFILRSDWLKLCRKKCTHLSNQIGSKVNKFCRIRIYKFSNLQGMLSPNWKPLRACLVPIVTNISNIFGPRCDQHCLVPIITNVLCMTLLPSLPRYVNTTVGSVMIWFTVIILFRIKSFDNQLNLPSCMQISSKPVFDRPVFAKALHSRKYVSSISTHFLSLP